MDSPAVHAKETMDDITWGGAAFAEWRPLPFAFTGLLLKGYTSFGDAGETGAGDFRIYGGFQLGPLRLEGGYRTIVYDLDLPDKSLSYTLYGAFVQFSAVFRF
jgi:hypothetical protein